MNQLYTSKYAYWLAFGIGCLLSYIFLELTQQVQAGWVPFVAIALWLAPMLVVDVKRKALNHED